MLHMKCNNDIHYHATHAQHNIHLNRTKHEYAKSAYVMIYQRSPFFQQNLVHNYVKMILCYGVELSELHMWHI